MKKNKLIHEYYSVDTEILWQPIQEDIGPLEATVGVVLAESA